MTQPAKVQEPSMEEILASIRRIIADDEARPATAGRLASSQPEKPAPLLPVRPSLKDVPSLVAAKLVAPPPTPRQPAIESATANGRDNVNANLVKSEQTAPKAEAVSPPRPDGKMPELTDAIALPDTASVAPATSFRPIEPQNDIESTHAAAQKTMHSQPTLEPPIERSSQPILSRSAENAVESAFNSLANTVLSHNARTLEDLVKEMLRPMLKSWLDENLPELVERIVKAEIERLSRGR